MTIAVVANTQEQGKKRVRVFTQTREALGETLGAAIDALQLDEATWETEEEPYLLLRRFQADRFFSEAQRERLVLLMEQWRSAKANNQALPAETQAELEALIAAEEEAIIARSQFLLATAKK